MGTHTPRSARMKYLAVVLLAALACASPLEKREAEAEPGYGYPSYSRGYGYPSYGYPYRYGYGSYYKPVSYSHVHHSVHKRSADPEPEAMADPEPEALADAEPGYGYSRGYGYPSYSRAYGYPYRYGYASYYKPSYPHVHHSVHKRSADLEPEALADPEPGYGYSRGYGYPSYSRAYGYPYRYGYASYYKPSYPHVHHSVHKRSADPEAEAL